MTDDLGDRMKGYEAAETGRRFMSLLPVYARIDGRCFSSFTRGMERPYDARMSRCMIDTTRYLVDELHAAIGYTQSDEISLAWHMPDAASDMPFGGKVFKLISVVASMTSAKFGACVRDALPEYADRLPAFDARVYQLPNRAEAANAFLWRELDATKNAVSMAARTVCSHAEMHGQGRTDQIELLHQRGINFGDYPAFFKRGTFVRRETQMTTLTADELARIPEAHRPTEPVLRSHFVEMDMPKFSTVTNREAVIFDGAQPEVQG